MMEINPPAVKVYVLLLALGLILPLAMSLAALFLAKSSMSSAGMAVVIALVLLPIVVIVAFIALRRNIEIEGHQLRVTGAFYSVALVLSEIRGEPRLIDAKSDSATQLVVRTNGIGLPGLQIGWFRLRNGEKCFAYITDEHPVYIQTKKGYSLLISVRSPDALMANIRSNLPR